jgi:hypothetical protein
VTKRTFLAQKNKLGLSLRTKKGLFWAKILIKIEFKGEKLINKKQAELGVPHSEIQVELDRQLNC